MKIIALWGKDSTGKTPSIKLFYKKLLKNGAEELLYIDEYDGVKYEDFYAIVSFKGKTIGVTSYGDNGNVLVDPFKEFNNYNCDIVITACRVRETEKGSVKFIKNQNSEIIYVEKIYIENADELPDKDEFIEKINDRQADILLNALEKAIND